MRVSQTIPCKYVSCVPQSFDPSQENVGLYRIGTINILGNSSILWLCLSRCPTSASKWVSHDAKKSWLVVSKIWIMFPFHTWDVIRNPLTKPMIFQDGYCTTSQNPLKWEYPILRSGIWKSKMIEIPEFEQKKIYQHHFQPDPRLTYLVLDSFL